MHVIFNFERNLHVIDERKESITKSLYAIANDVENGESKSLKTYILLCLTKRDINYR